MLTYKFEPMTPPTRAKGTRPIKPISHALQCYSWCQQIHILHFFNEPKKNRKHPPRPLISLIPGWSREAPPTPRKRNGKPQPTPVLSIIVGTCAAMRSDADARANVVGIVNAVGTTGWRCPRRRSVASNTRRGCRKGLSELCLPEINGIR